ncbi:MAG: hypothetical protein AAF497_15945 [Planctomycetota bacterium]
MSDQNFNLPPDAAARLEMLDKAESKPVKESDKQKNDTSKSKS